MEIGKVQAAPTAPVRPWTVLGHVDATAPDLEPYEMARLDFLTLIDKPDTNLVAQVRHEPVNKTAKAIKAAFQAILSPACAIAGVVATGAMLASGVAAVPAALFGGALLAEGAIFAGVSKSGVEQLKRLKYEPHNANTEWKGTRTLEYDHASGTAPRVVAEEKTTKAPDGEKLGRFLADNMKKYPAERYAFILGGHGRARVGVGDVSVDDMAKATRIAHQESGRKLDVLMLDSCLVGNVETLLPMANDVRYAVVSEEPLYTGVFDWTSVLNSVQGQQPSAQMMGHAAVHYSEFKTSPRTVSLVDMQQMGGLREALENLGGVLAEAARDGHRGAIRKAFDQATKIQDGGWLERHMENKLDLGDLLARLEQVPDARVLSAAGRALSAYRATVPEHAASDEFKTTTGLSIQGPRFYQDDASYGRETGLQQWGKALGQMKPWPARVMATAVEKTRSMLGLAS